MKKDRRPSIWDAGYPTPLATNPRASRAPIALLHGLAPGGVCPAGRSPARRCALTAPFHPYSEAGGTPDPAKGAHEAPGCRAVQFLWHFPSRRHAWVLPSTFARWSSDFPPLRRTEKAAVRPTDTSILPVSSPVALVAAPFIEPETGISRRFYRAAVFEARTERRSAMNCASTNDVCLTLSSKLEACCFLLAACSFLPC